MLVPRLIFSPCPRLLPLFPNLTLTLLCNTFPLYRLGATTLKKRHNLRNLNNLIQITIDNSAKSSYAVGSCVKKTTLQKISAA